MDEELTDDEVLLRLKPKHRRFCELYASTGNVTYAFAHSGYKYTSADSACTNGHRLLRRPDIRKALAVLQKREVEALNLDRSHLVRSLLGILRIAPLKPPTYSDHIKVIEHLSKMFGFDQPEPTSPAEVLDFDRLTPEEIRIYERLTDKARGSSNVPHLELPERSDAVHSPDNAGLSAVGVPPGADGPPEPDGIGGDPPPDGVHASEAREE
jgi:Terminase small subunit